VPGTQVAPSQHSWLLMQLCPSSRQVHTLAPPSSGAAHNMVGEQHSAELLHSSPVSLQLRQAWVVVPAKVVLSHTGALLQQSASSVHVVPAPAHVEQVPVLARQRGASAQHSLASLQRAVSALHLQGGADRGGRVG